MLNDIKRVWSNMSTGMKVALIAVVALVGFLLYRNATNQGAGGATPGQTNTAGAYPNNFYNDTINITKQTDTKDHPVPHKDPGSGSQPQTAFIRAAGSQPSVAAWDKSHSGIPVRSQPGDVSTFTKLLPFGSQVSISGAPVSGGSNFPGGGGSDLWYPIAGGGYISQYDIGTL